MLKVITFAAVAALALAVTVMPKPALARDDGAVAAGVIGGLAVGAIVGSQGDRDDGYRERHYRARYSDCHMERQEVNDRYGNSRVVSVRVCD
jgi:hypothetical protein